MLHLNDGSLIVGNVPTSCFVAYCVYEHQELLGLIMNRALHQAIHRLLRPLVRYMIGQGFTLTACAELLKTVYVEQALARHDSRVPTDSELSLVTGIHRKDIKRLRALVASGDPEPSLSRGTHMAAQLIATWVSSPDTREPDGTLKRLPIHGTTTLSFETLTRRIKADMRPRAILDDLVRTHAATIEEDGYVRLLRHAYVPGIPEEKLNFLAQNVGDHMASAFHNLSEGPPFLERALYMDALPQQALETARPRIEAAADQLLQTLHQELSPLEAGPKPGPGMRRLRVGIYYYEDRSHPQRENPDENSG